MTMEEWKFKILCKSWEECPLCEEPFVIRYAEPSEWEIVSVRGARLAGPISAIPIRNLGSDILVECLNCGGGARIPCPIKHRRLQKEKWDRRIKKANERARQEIGSAKQAPKIQNLLKEAFRARGWR